MRHCHGHGMGRGGHFLEALVLLLIAEEPAHGYEIAKKLSELGVGFEGVGPMGNLYRLLARLEAEGLVQSEWDVLGGGPARRMYRITEDGKQRLSFLADRLRFQKNLLEEFFKRYEQLFGQGRE
ncbi:PadR family transcriptional regulator [Pseudothermotoga hypogea DSM 11164 = NBRC 106472]|uniref:PadR family transcriptional regulator n=1 Tax=Pseudothermotoga hypogea DSM 11164 = NBRC 106472 TaxID=1123384 RepID=A0A0X1KRP0_9THEM|nr:PadR family transcriptional regulator [Pseudothermotoga hypogea DSM 11164 = NBRC 106472]